jgi:hypothetical protein
MGEERGEVHAERRLRGRVDAAAAGSAAADAKRPALQQRRGRAMPGEGAPGRRRMSEFVANGRAVRQGALLQLPVLMQVATSAQVACLPSSVQPHPNCEHHHCWLSAIAL